MNEEDRAMPPKRYRWWMVAVLLAGSLGLYGATMSRGVFPGLPAKIGLPLNLVLWAAYLEKMTGIVGNATVALVPGGNKHLVAVHQKAFDPPLVPGVPREHYEGVIFPARFEEDWRNGVIGAWLSTYRPDLLLPPGAGRR